MVAPRTRAVEVGRPPEWEACGTPEAPQLEHSAAPPAAEAGSTPAQPQLAAPRFEEPPAVADWRRPSLWPRIPPQNQSAVRRGLVYCRSDVRSWVQPVVNNLLRALLLLRCRRLLRTLIALMGTVVHVRGLGASVMKPPHRVGLGLPCPLKALDCAPVVAWPGGNGNPDGRCGLDAIAEGRADRAVSPTGVRHVHRGSLFIDGYLCGQVQVPPTRKFHHPKKRVGCVRGCDGGAATSSIATAASFWAHQPTHSQSGYSRPPGPRRCPILCGPVPATQT